jgi:nicotinate phosphoribosyltransferase
MTQLYLNAGIHRNIVQFEYFFRTYPDYGSHKAGYCINAGLEWFVKWIQNASITKDNLQYLRGQKSKSGTRLFSDTFIQWLQNLSLVENITIRAIPEGRVVHPHEPVVIIEGELAALQILETSLLNIINYQILIATKASRIKEAGANRPVIEFGLRRAHHTGANAGTRAALIGGADYSSNTGISYKLGFDPKGTHAHSLVQLFIAMGEGELGAFRAYAENYPDDCLLLVDTINTLESGIPNAITVFKELSSKGHSPVGIRLDSGDLAYLSVQACRMLNDAGFPDTTIVLSNNIDEMVLLQVLDQIRIEASIYRMDYKKIIDRLTYGVGTKLITSHGCSSLDGVYKLSAVKKDNTWIPAMKITDTPAKALIPGDKKLWRIYGKSGRADADLICLKDENPTTMETIVLRHPFDPIMSRTLKNSDILSIEPLLVDIFDHGKPVYEFPPVKTLRTTKENDLNTFDPGVKRLINPHYYHVSLSERLWELKESLVKRS